MQCVRLTMAAIRDFSEFSMYDVLRALARRAAPSRARL